MKHYPVSTGEFREGERKAAIPENAKAGLRARIVGYDVGSPENLPAGEDHPGPLPAAGT